MRYDLEELETDMTGLDELAERAGSLPRHVWCCPECGVNLVLGDECAYCASLRVARDARRARGVTGRKRAAS